MVRGIQVQADDIADLLDEEWVGGQLEVALAVRLDAEQVEPALHGTLGDAGVLGHGADAPVGGARGDALQRGVDDFGDLLVFMDPRPSGSQFVVQAFQALFQETPPPLADGDRGQLHPLGDGVVRFTCGTGEHDLRALHDPVRKGAGAGEADQLVFFFLAEGDRWDRARHGQAPVMEHTLIISFIYGT